MIEELPAYFPTKADMVTSNEMVLALDKERYIDNRTKVQKPSLHKHQPI